MTRMSLKKILLHPDPRLKKTCEPVTTIDASLRKLAEDMLETMYNAPGVGLAAPQLGILKRLFVMDIAAKEAEPEPCILFNPRISWASDDLNTHEEGCLSIPEFYGDVTRPDKVRMVYLNIDGKEVEDEFEGLGATCVQHELDHLNGRLFIDYLSAVKRGMITNKMKKLKKEQARDA